MPNVARVLNMGPSTEFYGLPETNGTYRIAIFFTEQRHGPFFQGLGHGDVSLFLQRQLSFDSSIDKIFNFP